MAPRASAGPVSRWEELVGRGIGLFAVVFVAYTAGAVLSWVMFGSTFGPAFFFPSAGVTVAAMILSRRALWPGVAAAAMLGEVIVDVQFGNTVGISLGYGVADVVEPIVGASVVLALCGGVPDLRKRRDFFAFLAGACVIGPAAGGVIGGFFGALSRSSPWTTEALHWWAGDALGVLVVATPILLWTRQSAIVRRRPAETALVLGVTSALSAAAIWSDAPPSILLLPVLAWAALRLDMLGAALAGAVAAFLANVVTVRGRGFFSSMDIDSPMRVVVMQVFIGVIIVVSLLIAQEASGRTRAIREREVERRERMRLETLSGLAQQLSAALRPEDIGRALEDQVVNDAGVTSFNLGLLSADASRLDWVVMSGYPQPVIDEYGGGVAMSERTAATDAVRTGRPVLIRDADEYQRRYADKVHWIRMSGAQTVVGWPLDTGGSPNGVLLLVWTEPQPLNSAQLAYISAVATMVSQALARAKIYADEHARAAVLQAAVLPSTPIDTAGVQVCITYEPADTVGGLGGDWYDVMPLPKGRTYFAVGDVVGHGLAAVEDMAQLRAAGRAFAHQGLSPAQLLSELNGFARHATQGRFATMAVAVWDPAAGTLSYCSAGHPPALLRSSQTGEVTRLGDAHGPVLGPLEDAGYPEGRRQIVSGDVLVMYTDGLVERRGTDIDDGITRVAEVVAGWDVERGLEGRCRLLHEELAPRPRPDDICIIAVRFD